MIKSILRTEIRYSTLCRNTGTSKKYDVVMNKGLLSMAGMYIKDALGLKDDPLTGTLKDKKICIVTDATVAPLYGEKEP